MNTTDSGRLDFDVIRRSGLRVKDEMEMLMGVKRLSIYNYMKGKSVPSRHTAPRIETVLIILDQLVARGKLPLPKQDSEKRKQSVEKLAAFINARRASN